jgi:D-alanyl-D-alanine carboxypeptidase
MLSRSSKALGLLLAALITGCSAPVATPAPTDTPSPPITGAPTSTPTSVPTSGPPETSPSEPTPTPPPTLPAGPLADALGPQLDEVLQQTLEQYRIPGQSATVVFPDGSRWNGAAGVADVANDTPVTTDTTFVTGSITKTFVAAAIMQLQEEGVLSIDDPLSDWLPEYPNAENITLRQLLSHQSGLFNYFLHPDYNARVFNEPDHHWTPQEVLDEFVLEPKAEPGARYYYSNTNFLLLGLVIEAATGQDLGAVLHQRFIEPLGLDSTFVQGYEAPAPGSALGCLQKPNGPECLDDGTDYRPTESAATVAWGAGDIVSTPSDLADWARAIYESGSDFLDDGSVAEMTDYVERGRESYGLGTRTRVTQDQRAFGHTGSLRGYSAAMWQYPEIDTSIVVLTNRGRIEANPIVDALAEVAIPYSEAYLEAN